MIYKKCNKTDKKYSFRKFKTIRYFGSEVYNGITTLNDAFEEQINLKDDIDKCIESTRPKSRNKEDKEFLMLLKV